MNERYLMKIQPAITGQRFRTKMLMVNTQKIQVGIAMELEPFALSLNSIVYEAGFLAVLA